METLTLDLSLEISLENIENILVSFLTDVPVHIYVKRQGIA